MHQTRCFILRFSVTTFISATTIHAEIGFTPGDDHMFMNAGSGRVGLDIRSTKQNASRISHGEWLTDDNGLRYVHNEKRISPIAGFTKFGPYQTFTTSDSAVST